MDLGLYGGPACLFACNDPRFPGCGDLLPTSPLCDAETGLCEPCGTDEQCRTQATGPFGGPYCRDDGSCGCGASSDCPNHEVCGGPYERSPVGSVFGQCVAPQLSCTRDSCGGSNTLCDWDSGFCVIGSSCVTDFDCSSSANGPFCDQDAGECFGCRGSADCVTTGQAANGNSSCVQGFCSEQCETDIDCVGSPYGPRCVTDTGPHHYCAQCLSDIDCVVSPNGPHCQTNPAESPLEACTCLSGNECGPGQACAADAGLPAQCSGQCQSDTDCPPAFFCDVEACRPRCDDGGAGCRDPELICDYQNINGNNGYGAEGIALRA